MQLTLSYVHVHKTYYNIYVYMPKDMSNIHETLRVYIKLHIATLHAQYIMWQLLTLDTKLHVVHIIQVCNIFFLPEYIIWAVYNFNVTQ
jgi:hypothetical protein